jgi:tripartite-type tricarboxylate transporter receptor subunit TctC
MMNRRSALMFAALAMGGLPAFAAAYPDKPVQLIVPYAAGGPTDLVARLLADGLSEIWKERVYVVNKPGASGLLGVQTLTASPPDGYNLMLSASAAFVIYPALFDKAPYDSIHDFTALSKISYSDLILVVRSDLPVHDVKELIAYVRAHPGKVSYGSAGIGALNHVGGELFRKLTGTDIQHIPYKGDAPVINDLVNGDVTMSFLSSQLAIPQIKAGQFKALAVTGPTRVEGLDDVPTMMESGLKDFNLRAWNAVVGPKGMPPALVHQINAAIVQAMARPGVKARLADLGLAVETGTPEAFSEQLRTESAKWRSFVKSAGIKLD